ncbi:MAG: hypothetical protein IK997_04550 [Bacilli bacterium]|nr:hypothetical protein [Bacilli bacterium]
MKEGIGNTVVISLVMVFIVFMSSYLAFTINYSKAFKMKSKLIDVIQSHNNNMNDEEIAVEMNNYINEIGYSTNSETMQSNCTNAGYSVMEGATGWCYKEFSSEVNDEGNVRRYVKIRTFISVDIPFINRIFNKIRVFTVEGSTKPTYSHLEK